MSDTIWLQKHAGTVQREDHQLSDSIRRGIGCLAGTKRLPPVTKKNHDTGRASNDRLQQKAAAAGVQVCKLNH